VKQLYKDKNFSTERFEVIELANQIIEDYVAQGFVLTLRQTYYQFIGRDWFPETWIDEKYNLRKGLRIDTKNTEKNYKRLGNIISDARLAEKIDWEHIEERTRVIKRNSHWDDPQDIILGAAQSYEIDKWDDQEYRTEVWIEKDALMGVIERVCKENDVPYFSCRGYSSQSAMHEAALRLEEWEVNGQETIIFYLGDHDPSGIDMTRDIRERMELFGCNVEVKRIALNMNQIEEYNPPPNPTKTTDSRSSDYIEQYGEDSWELDSLEPSVMVNLIRASIESVRDENAWKAQVDKEQEESGTLELAAEHWDSVVDFLEDCI